VPGSSSIDVFPRHDDISRREMSSIQGAIDASACPERIVAIDMDGSSRARTNGGDGGRLFTSRPHDRINRRGDFSAW
jgi:hypothetical protein